MPSPVFRMGFSRQTLPWSAAHGMILLLWTLRSPEQGQSQPQRAGLAPPSAHTLGGRNRAPATRGGRLLPSIQVCPLGSTQPPPPKGGIRSSGVWQHLSHLLSKSSFSPQRSKASEDKHREKSWMYFLAKAPSWQHKVQGIGNPSQTVFESHFFQVVLYCELICHENIFKNMTSYVWNFSYYKTIQSHCRSLRNKASSKKKMRSIVNPMIPYNYC